MLCPLVHLLVGLVVGRFDVIEHAQILDRVNFAGDHQRHAAHQRFVGWVFRQQRRIWMGFFEIFDYRQGLGENPAVVLQRRY